MTQKILIISPDIPYPLTKGGRQGMFHFIDKLRNEYDFSILFILNNTTEDGYEKLQKIWDNVTFYPFIEKGSVVSSPSLLGRIYRFPYILKEKFSSKFKKKEEKYNVDFIREHSSLYNSIPIHISPDFIEYVRTISFKDFDKIQVEFYPYISLVHILPDRVEKIFIHHELRYVRNEIEMSYFKEVTSYDRYIYKVSKEFELCTLNKYDKIVAVTDVDRYKLAEENITSEIFDSSSIITKPQQTKNNKTFFFNNKLTFIGSSTHFPNYDGLNWFLKEIWPKVLSNHPKVEFHIVGGGWNPELFKEIPNFENVYFDGYIEDLTEILPNTVSIVPIRIGSGMRMKIIDAVNYNIPFITTTVGVEGLDFVDGQDCFIADNSDSFAQKIDLLLSSAELQNKFIENSTKVLDLVYNEEFLLNKRRLVYETKQT